MFAGLRLDGLVDGHDEQHQVDTAHSGEHVFHKTLVTGNIHETQAKFRRQLQVSETDVDGDAAALFLFETIRVDAGESLHQGGFAMVNMAGGTDDNVLHGARYHRTTRLCGGERATSGARWKPCLPRRRFARKSGRTGGGSQRTRDFRSD